MATDTNRAAFVQLPYRHVDATDNFVKARAVTARSIEINTNLDEVRAQALADAFLAENNSPRVFEIVLEGTDHVDLADGVPRFIADLPKYKTDNRVLKLVSFTEDYEANTTTLQVRG
jgi:hypothetical protein